MLKKFGLFFLCGVSLCAMHNAELDINEKDLEFSVKLDMGQFSNNIEPESVYVGAKFLHPDIDNSNVNNSTYTDLTNYYELNFLMRRDIKKTKFSVGMGVKLNASKKFASIPLGMEFGYKIPSAEFIPMALNINIYYAPEVLTMGDAMSFLEYRIYYDIEVIKNAMLTIGYRSLNIKYESNLISPYLKKDLRYNTAPYAGFKFAF